MKIISVPLLDVKLRILRNQIYKYNVQTYFEVIEILQHNNYVPITVTTFKVYISSFNYIFESMFGLLRHLVENT